MSIEQMALSAGLDAQENAAGGEAWFGSMRDIERFAALVRAQALEEAAALCDQRIQYWQRDDIRRYEDELCAARIRALKSDSKPLP